MSIFSLSIVCVVSVFGSFILFDMVESEIYTSIVGNYICVHDDVTRRTWSEADEYCASTYGTNLASIHSFSDETDFISSLILSSIYTYFGLNDIDNEAFADGSIGSGWEYTDGTEYDYVVSWATGEPNAVQDCGAYIIGSLRPGFHDLICAYQSPQFVCNYNSKPFICASECEELTDALGCANNECLENCDNCVSDIAWYDYAGGQDVSCQCHNNGCDQCQNGYFKIDYDFPCQSCNDSFDGCLHCTDFYGCQQCEDGYSLVEDDTCGENSYHNTGNLKIHYCKKERKYPTQNPTPEPTPNPVTDPQCPNYIYGSYNSCSGDDKCESCQSWGCEKCDDGHYKMGNFERCQSCTDNYPNCNKCSDWNGCIECQPGFELIWSNQCNDQICV